MKQIEFGNHMADVIIAEFTKEDGGMRHIAAQFTTVDPDPVVQHDMRAVVGMAVVCDMTRAMLHRSANTTVIGGLLSSALAHAASTYTSILGMDAEQYAAVCGEAAAYLKDNAATLFGAAAHVQPEPVH